MTMTPVGDKGQRYEVSAFNYPMEGETCAVGWVEHIDDAERMAKAIALDPSCASWTIRDRWNATPEWPGGKFTQMVGAKGLR